MASFTDSSFSSPTRSANLEQLFWMGYWTDAVQCNYFMVHHHFRGSISMIIFHFKCFEYVKSITLMTMYNTLRMLVHFLEPGASFMNHFFPTQHHPILLPVFLSWGAGGPDIPLYFPFLAFIIFHLIVPDSMNYLLDQN